MRILENKIFGKLLAILGLILILAAVSGTLMEKEIRFGFFVSLLFVALIAFAALIMQKVVWKKERKRTF